MVQLVVIIVIILLVIGSITSGDVVVFLQSIIAAIVSVINALINLIF